jgi:bifunctional non-homologous end joining protein LigD
MIVKAGGKGSGVGELSEYRRRRDPAKTPEPVPDADVPPAQAAPPPPGGDRFVVQEHHARALHWDVRLERDGVLVSWAVPKGLPRDPATNRLAVRTEDHPLEYATFTGDIPAGKYGAGRMTIWDRGTYETQTWTDREVKVVLHGERVQGRYVFFRTGPRDRDWMVHRMDPPADGWEPLPARVRPMLATAGALPPPEEDDDWAYEVDWGGTRAVAHVDGGRLRLTAHDDVDVTRDFPEVRGLAEALGARPAVLDGVLLGTPGHGSAVYLAFDVVHLDGRPLLEQPYRRRRAVLDGLELAGPAWRTPPPLAGSGVDVLAASRENGLAGLIAKRQASPYRPGRRSPDWRRVTHRPR